MTAFTLKDLEAIIAARTATSAEASYTRSLLEKGPVHCAKKMGEEAVETVIAAVETDTKALVAESADLVYHWMVLLRSRGIALDDVLSELERRTAQSGHAEKAQRPKA